MRKLLWGGVALLVLGATSVYIAADHAAKNPNSFLGRYASGAVSIVLTGNPFAAAHQLQNANGGALPDDVVCGPGDPAEVAKPILVPPQEEIPNTEEEEAPQDVPEPTQVIQVPRRNESGFAMGVYSIPNEDSTTSAEDIVFPDVVDGSGWVLPGSNPGDFEAYSDFVMAPMIEEVPVMPEVVDDEETTDSTTYEKTVIDEATRILESGMETMPVKPTIPQIDSRYEQPTPTPPDPTKAVAPVNNEDAANETDNYSWWIRLFGLEKMFESTPEPTPEPTTEIEPTPTNDMTEEMPQRDPNYHRYHYQGCPYSGCPYPHASYPVPVYTPPAQEDRPPVADPTPTPMPETPETKTPAKHRKHGCANQMDAGCDIMGSCPSNVPTCVPSPVDVTPPVVEPTPTPDASETKTPAKHHHHGCHKSYHSFWQGILSNLEEANNQPTVDTMECRPTDVPQFDLRRLMPF